MIVCPLELNMGKSGYIDIEFCKFMRNKSANQLDKNQLTSHSSKISTNISLC